MAKSVEVNFDEIRKALKTEKNKSVQDALKLVLAAAPSEDNSATSMYILNIFETSNRNDYYFDILDIFKNILCFFIFFY